MTATVTVTDIDALLSGATPQFSMQLKARLWAMIEGLPAGDQARAYGEAQMQLLDRLAMGTTRAARGPAEPPADAAGWEAIPSHPTGGPLPGLGSSAAGAAGTGPTVQDHR